MAEKKETSLAPARAPRDPFALLRQLTSELDRVFDTALGSAFRWPFIPPAGPPRRRELGAGDRRLRAR